MWVSALTLRYCCSDNVASYISPYFIGREWGTRENFHKLFVPADHGAPMSSLKVCYRGYSLGSYVRANTGIFFFQCNFSESNMFSGYPFSKRSSFSSTILLYIFSGSEQILTILKCKDIGFALVVILL